MGRRRSLLAVFSLAMAALVVLVFAWPGSDAVDRGSAVDRTAEEKHSPPVLRGAVPGEEPPPIEPAGCIAGRVVDEEGRPVRGLAVRIDHERDRIECDEEGHFDIEGLEPGPHGVVATDPKGGQVGKPREVSVAADLPCAQVELVVPVPRLIGGVVVSPDGLPVPGLLIGFRPVAGAGWPRRVTTTDATGGFGTRVFREGPFEAVSRRVKLLGECRVGSTGARLVYDPASRKEMLLRIVDYDGALIPRCALSVLTGSQHNQTGSNLEVEGGLHRVRMDGPRPLIEIRVRNPRDDSGAPLPLSDRYVKDIDREASELEICLEAAREVRGVVVDERGSPVPEIRVTASHADRQIYFGPLAGAKSNSEGRFVLSRLPKAPVVVRVRSGQGPWGPTPETTVPEHQDEVRIVIRRGGTFRVCVRGPDGAPVVGAEIHLSWFTDRFGRKREATDAAGVAAFEGVPATALLSVSVWTDKVTQPLPPWSQDDIPSSEHELFVDLPAPVEISGTVVDEARRPWCEGYVYAIGTTDATRGPADKARPDAKTGAFVLRRLRPGPHRVWLQNHRYGDAPSAPTEVVAPLAGLRILRPTPGVVTGRLHVDDPEHWDVTWFQEPGGGSTKIDKQGRFRIVGLRKEVSALFAYRIRRPQTTPGTRSVLLEGVRPGRRSVRLASGVRRPHRRAHLGLRACAENERRRLPAAGSGAHQPAA